MNTNMQGQGTPSNILEGLSHDWLPTIASPITDARSISPCPSIGRPSPLQGAERTGGVRARAVTTATTSDLEPEDVGSGSLHEVGDEWETLTLDSVDDTERILPIRRAPFEDDWVMV